MKVGAFADIVEQAVTGINMDHFIDPGFHCMVSVLEDIILLRVRDNGIRQAGGVPQFINWLPAIVYISVRVIDNHKNNLHEAI
jgi:hypothetical protein